MKEIRDILTAWRKFQSQPLALATLVRAHGSSYRRPGARMLVCPDGTTVGALSGGCLEEEVAARAREVLRLGTPSLMHFDTRRRFGCHGAIEIFVEKADDSLGVAIEEALRERTACAVETVFEGTGFRGSRVVGNNKASAPGAFVQTIVPPIRLAIIGDGPDLPPFAGFAVTLGWEMVALSEISEWQLGFDDWTAVIVATHNYGRDCAALRFLLPGGLKYVGLMGPRRRREELMSDLLDSGVAITSEFFAPAGLHLEADSPEEIALSIVAEIQSVFANGSAVPLRDRRVAIHHSVSSAQRRHLLLPL